MPQNVFHFEFFFSIHQLRGWSKVIGSLLFGLSIRGQQRGVEDVMDGPGRRELEFVRHWRDLLSDDERPMMFWSEFVCHCPSPVTRSVSTCPLKWGMGEGHVIV